MDTKRVAVIGGIGASIGSGALMAAIAATGSQVEIISGYRDLPKAKAKNWRNKSDSQRIKRSGTQ